MSYFAAALVRGAEGWAAADLRLTGAADVGDIADRLRDVEPEADLSLLFVESDEVYLVIMRLDEGEDPRVFGSDSVFAEESRLGALLLGDIEAPAVAIDDLIAVGDVEVDEPDVDPVGDADLLADLGIPAHDLLALCRREGLQPADVTAEVCQRIGCGDLVEELRESVSRV